MTPPSTTASDSRPPCQVALDRLAASLGLHPWLALLLALPVFMTIASWRALHDYSDFGSQYDGLRRFLANPTAFDPVRRYPPTFAVLLAPLGFLPLWLATAVWVLLSAGCLAALPRICANLTGIAIRDQWPAWLVAAPFLVDNLVLGQNGPMLLFLVSLGLLLVKRGRWIGGVPCLPAAC